MHVFSACMLVFCKLFIHVSVTTGSCDEEKIESLESSTVNAFYDLTSEDVGGRCLLTLLTQILHMHIMRWKPI